MKVNNMFAIYDGNKYRCGTSKGGKQVDLYSDSKTEGFYDILNIGVFMRSVPKNECDRVWKQELFFKYMDDTFRVWDIKGSKLYLRADGNSFDAEKYGFEVCEIEKYGHKIYGKWVDETDGEKEWHITEY